MKKKLIEVSIPLEAINAQAAREKSIRHGHPSTLHLWWARRPLAACRAVLFASLVDDPSSNPDKFPTEEAQEEERTRLHLLIELLVDWDTIGDAKLLKDLITGHANEKFRKLLAWDFIDGKTLYEAAYGKILESTNNNPPPVLDPFAGGGSIPLEAQRLGLEAHASDLNPVAVLINKALIEIPPKFKDMPPVNPKARANIGGDSEWKGAAGLAEDVRYYGEWMREEAFNKIGRLYPRAKLPDGTEARVIAWIWARTVKCPNPVCGAEMPLVNSYWLSKKKGKEVCAEPVIDKNKKTISFVVNTGKEKPPESPKAGRGATFRCECCGQIARDTHIKSESMAGRMGVKLMAIVTEGTSGRVYLSPTKEHEEIAKSAKPAWKPEQEMNRDTTNLVSGRGYGFFTWGDLFTPRQLTALTTFSDLVGDAITQAQADGLAAGLPADDRGLDAGGKGARAYGEAVGVYLACAVDKGTNIWSSICSWMNDRGAIRETFARQAIPMVWDYAEANPFSEAGGNISMFVERCVDVLKAFPSMSFNMEGYVKQLDAAQISFKSPIVISTDPPYYDNIGYADLSDFFYIWLRRSLQKVYPNLFSTMLVPKAEELVATPFRFDGDKEKAKIFFEDGMLKAFQTMRQTVSSDFPLTVYYAYKQSENEADGETKNSESSSSGWETMIQAIINAGFSITGTWPLRTESPGRSVAQNSNALASSIAIVCRPRPEDALSITRRAFQAELREALKDGLHYLQAVNIAPVDLAQASIGPGIAVYSKYREILKADDTQMTVHDALVMINQELDAYLSTQTGNLDSNSQFCIAWFEQYGMQAAEYGSAETLAKAKLAHIQDLAGEGVLESGRGKVRLTKRSELPETWNIDQAKSIWAMVQGLCLAMDKGGKESAAAAMVKIIQENPAAIDNIKSLAYRAYMISDRKGWNDEALAYNSLVSMWPDISTEMNKIAREKPQPKQAELRL